MHTQCLAALQDYLALVALQLGVESFHVLLLSVLQIALPTKRTDYLDSMVQLMSNKIFFNFCLIGTLITEEFWSTDFLTFSLQRKNILPGIYIM